MSAQKQLKLEIIIKVLAGEIERQKAAQILDVSLRSVERYLRDYRIKGPAFIEHGNTGRTPANKTSWEIKLQTQTLIRDKYYDFNMTHCREQLVEFEKEVLPSLPQAETIRGWCHEIHHVKHKMKRRSKARYARQRMKQAGLMLQMDGSPHRWFGDHSSCMIAAIDDATSDVPYAEFFHSEDTISCMRVLQKVIEKRGLFQILYVDKAGIFGGAKRANFSQVKRALKELGIHIIFAHSPEAKGRIERLNETFQDRLIPEMRLRNIKSFPSANSYLQEQFLPNQWTQKFTVPACDPTPAYRPLSPYVDLKEIFCVKEYRMVKRDHTLSWNNEIYSLLSPVKYSIYRQNIEIRTYQDLTWKAFYAGKSIELVPFKQAKQRDFTQNLKLSA